MQKEEQHALHTDSGGIWIFHMRSYVIRTRVKSIVIKSPLTWYQTSIVKISSPFFSNAVNNFNSTYGSEFEQFLKA